jgi:hypothetical protein
LKLQVPVKNVTADAAAGGTLLAPAATPEGSELTVLGLGGELKLSWRGPNQQGSAAGALIEAEGAHLLTIERGTVHTQAQLTLRSLGGDIDRVRVRLPPGARLGTAAPSNGYSVRNVEGDKPGPGAPPRPLVEIQPEKKGRGPLSVRFEFTQSYDVAGPPTFLELGTLEIEGAARHWGAIAIETAGDWHLSWGNMAQVRRVDTVPAALSKNELAAAFEYSGQPYVLSARITPPTTMYFRWGQMRPAARRLLNFRPGSSAA